MDFFWSPEFWQYVQNISIVAGSLGGIFLFWRQWVRPFLVTKLYPYLDAIFSLPALAEKTESILAEVRPNSGSSMRDAIARIENNVQSLRVRSRIVFNSNTEVAVFELNLKGEMVFVSKTFTEWTGKRPDELLGWNWINAVPQAERSIVTAEWTEFLRTQRESLFQHGLIFHNDNNVPVTTKIFPIRLEDGTIEAWVGFITRQRTPTGLGSMGL